MEHAVLPGASLPADGSCASTSREPAFEMGRSRTTIGKRRARTPVHRKPALPERDQDGAGLLPAAPVPSRHISAWS